MLLFINFRISFWGFFLDTPRRLQDLSSRTRNWTRATAVKASSPNHWTAREFPRIRFLFRFFKHMIIFKWSIIIQRKKQAFLPRNHSFQHLVNTILDISPNIYATQMFKVGEVLSPCATTTEAHASTACAPQQKKTPQWKARAPQRRGAPARRN